MVNEFLCDSSVTVWLRNGNSYLKNGGSRYKKEKLIFSNGSVLKMFNIVVQKIILDLNASPAMVSRIMFVQTTEDVKYVFCFVQD